MISYFHNKLNKKGFTLLELIIVIAIIGILVLLATPWFTGYIAKAKVANIKHDIKIVENSVEYDAALRNYDLTKEMLEDPTTINEKIEEGKVYNKRGLIRETIDDNYYIITNSNAVKTTRTKLDGEFLANKDGLVLYVSDKKIKDVNGEDEYNNDNGDNIIPDIINGIVIDDLEDGVYVFIQVADSNGNPITIPGGLSYEITDNGHNSIQNVIIDDPYTKVSGLPNGEYVINDKTFNSDYSKDKESQTFNVDGSGVVVILFTWEAIEDPIGDLYSYYTYNNEIILTGITVDGDNYFKGDVIFPNEIDGLPVVRIDSNSFNTIDSYKYNYNITSIVLGENIREIGAKAFYFNGGGSGNTINSLHLPDSVITIEDYAFSNTNILSLTGGNNLEHIGNNAFEQNSITALHLPVKLKYIGSNAFRAGTLETVSIPNSVEYMGQYAFSNNNIQSLSIGSGITSLNEGVFAYNNFTDVILPNNLTIIKTMAFNQGSLERLTIPDSVINIESTSFYNNNITSLHIGSGLSSIGNSVFARNSIAELTIPSNVKEITLSAFRYNQIETLTFHNGITKISDNAFSDNKISALSLPDSLESLSATPFINNSLQSVNIGSGLKSISGGNPFYGSSTLNTIIVDPSNLYFDAIYGNLYSINGKTLYTGTLAGYMDIAENAEIIADHAFRGLGIDTINLPDTIYSIGNSAFAYNNINNVIIPDGVKILGASAFRYNGINSNSGNVPSWNVNLFQEAQPGNWILNGTIWEQQ